MIDSLIKQFQNPDKSYRGAPFWAWNSKLNPEELKRQIRSFHDMGFGGFFMHARVGLNTKYLSPEWFQCIKTCIAEAEKLDMNAYLYDEDRWPSGAAGSLVTREDRFKIRFCKYELLEKADQSQLGGTDLAWFSAETRCKDGKIQIIRTERLTAPEDFRPGGDRRLLRFAVVLAKKSPWFNGETYLDTLNPEAVRAFLDSTHEAYAREVGEKFGQVIPAIFSDEPSFSHGHTEFPIPWTGELPERFRKKYNRELTDLLPEIFFVSMARYSAARLQFMDTVTELFVEAFPKQIGEWCEQHQLAMTGHALLEDSLFQSFFVGSVMRFYEYMQMPGIDLLTEHWSIFNTAKQCSSMAHQFGRRHRLSETYGCTGWDFPFMGHKALGEWQYALGINFRCHHLAWYSAEGEAKRDYPASISYQSPWAQKYSQVEDYFARLGSALSQGEEVVDLLVIHPIETAWLGLDFENARLPFGQREQAMAQTATDRQFTALTNRLLEQKLDFDFGEEEVISRHGKIQDGRIHINQAAYKAVLLPPLKTIRRTTLNLLVKFARAGGQVVYLGSVPTHLDGFPSPIPGEAYRNFRSATFPQAVELLSPLIRRISVSRPSGSQIEPVLTRLVKNQNSYCAFLVNCGHRFSTEFKQSPLVRDRRLAFPKALVKLNIPRCGAVYELNPADGTIHGVKAVYSHDHYEIQTAFDRLESHLYLVSPQLPEQLVQNARPALSVRARPLKYAPDSWKCIPDELNLLVLDHAAWTVEDQTEQQADFILNIDSALRKILGKAPRGGEMVQPWCRNETPPEKRLSLQLRYSFEIRNLPPEDCLLAVEHPEFYEFFLNGTKISSESDSWWCDRDIRNIVIPRKLLKTGSNSLILKSSYHENLPGLEAIYLRGTFGVLEDVIVRQPEQLRIGDWGPQGFPYYPGNMTYCADAVLPPEGGILRIPEWRGVTLGVRINGAPEVQLPWPPFRMSLPGGHLNLEITVYGSRRNAMGPFYWHTAWPIWTGPYQFKVQEQPLRQLVPSGLLKAPVICC